MIAELGHLATVLALAVAIIQTVGPLAGQYAGRPKLVAVAEPAALAQFALLVIAFAALTHAFVTSDFSVSNVVANSHSTKPMLYKVAGVWGNHEGSMLLWVLIVALFGGAVAIFGRNLPTELRANVLAIQGLIGVAFLLFIVLTSNPFTRVLPPAVDGNGLNPILQDPALAFHPPFLYAGYVGFSMAFSFAIAALISGRIDAAWARWVRPWTLAAWMCLTIGISMGSWWAYYELGWGGWWFWDPVENASFMPWLLGTALLHSALVMEKRDALKIWTILLAILTFSMSLLGTFLVRSGVLTSVHAFAVDPERGVFILGILTFFTGGGLAMFAIRGASLRTGGIFAPISREGSLILNNLLLTVSCVAVLIGTLYPLFLEGLTGEKISVGPPFFNATFIPLMIPLLIALPFGPMLAWKRGDAYAALQRLFVALGAALFVLIFAYAFVQRGPGLAPFGLALGVWLIVGALSEIAFRAKVGKAGSEEVLRRLRNLPRSAYGTMLAHLGVGVMVLGIVGTSAWQTEKIIGMNPGATTQFAGYNLTFQGVSVGTGPNYSEQVGNVAVTYDGKPIVTLQPSKRRYNAPPQGTSEAGIYNAWSGDLYVILGDKLKDGAYTMRLYFNPLVRLIWIGTLIMFVGGFLSLTDRRLRVGAPRKAATPPPNVVPAE